MFRGSFAELYWRFIYIGERNENDGSTSRRDSIESNAIFFIHVLCMHIRFICTNFCTRDNSGEGGIVSAGNARGHCVFLNYCSASLFWHGL